jgi:hypothetical protein
MSPSPAHNRPRRQLVQLKDTRRSPITAHITGTWTVSLAASAFALAVATRALICSFVSCWEASSELLRSATLACSGRSQAQLLAPADHERVIVAVADGKPFREHHGRDGLVPGEQAARVA